MMKNLILLLLSILGSLSLGAQSIKSIDFKVYGNCGMCENRIEKAAGAVEGVKKADWDRASKMLPIEYDSDKVNLDDVHKKIAEAGHDTDKVRAKDDVYNALPACCHYERAPGDKTGQVIKSSGSCCTR